MHGRSILAGRVDTAVTRIRELSWLFVSSHLLVVKLCKVNLMAEKLDLLRIAYALLLVPHAVLAVPLAQGFPQAASAVIAIADVRDRRRGVLLLLHTAARQKHRHNV